jgi:hypothetical protein
MTRGVRQAKVLSMTVMAGAMPFVGRGCPQSSQQGNPRQALE